METAWSLGPPLLAATVMSRCSTYQEIGQTSSGTAVGIATKDQFSLCVHSTHLLEVCSLQNGHSAIVSSNCSHSGPATFYSQGLHTWFTRDCIPQHLHQGVCLESCIIHC